jgi:hypothetical protein
MVTDVSYNARWSRDGILISYVSYKKCCTIDHVDAP